MGVVGSRFPGTKHTQLSNIFNVVHKRSSRNRYFRPSNLKLAFSPRGERGKEVGRI